MTYSQSVLLAEWMYSRLILAQYSIKMNIFLSPKPPQSFAGSTADILTFEKQHEYDVYTSISRPARKTTTNAAMHFHVLSRNSNR